MRIIIDIGHPAHVHLFKNLIWNLEKKGHKITIPARDKDVTMLLLKAYKLEYENRGKGYDGFFGKAAGIIETNRRLYKIAKKTKPDLLIGVHNPYIAQVSKLIRKPSIIFTDTEHAKLANKLTFPFATVICTPSCFAKKLGKKQVRYNGYHELAYLHPNYFEPDPSVLNEIGLSTDDKYIILRFVSWSASHDVREHGFDFETKQRFINELESYGTVFITSETKLGRKFDKYRIGISPEKIHHLLYYATLYVGEGATMASEAAVLGTPAIYLNTLRLGYLDEQEVKYGLVHNFSNLETAQKHAFEKVLMLLGDNCLKEKWQKRREELLKEKIDVTKWMTEFIENYPESYKEVNNERSKKSKEI